MSQSPSELNELAAPQTVEELEERLSRPPAYLIDALGRLAGDILLLGVGGKMGPTMARMARRACDAAGVRRRVIGVSRFSSAAAREVLERHGVETISCDLLDEAALASLPDAPLVVYLAGMKFGATGNEALTWAMNCYLPALVSNRYPASRIVAFSTGNVYGLVPVSSGGSREEDPPHPEGEYAMSCLGRERMFEHFSRAQGTPQVLVRLNYATELRYGVLVDLAREIAAGRPVDISMGYANVIWQGDANALALASLAHAASPPLVLNMTGPELLKIRDVCADLGRLLGREVTFTGRESPDALLSNSQRLYDLLARPRVSAAQLIEWTADWVARGGPLLGKPTHFQVRDGKF